MRDDSMIMMVVMAKKKMTATSKSGGDGIGDTNHQDGGWDAAGGSGLDNSGGDEHECDDGHECDNSRNGQWVRFAESLVVVVLQWWYAPASQAHPEFSLVCKGLELGSKLSSAGMGFGSKAPGVTLTSTFMWM